MSASPRDDKTIKHPIQDLLNAVAGVKANFVVLAGQDIGRKYEIKKAELGIGRSEQSDIFIDDPDVSRNHAKIEVLNDSIIVQDLGSTNGTLVNGKAITRHQLMDGDRVQVGNLTILKFNFLDNIEDTFNEQLYNQANKDFLTQIYNRKYFLDRLKMEFSYSRRHEVPLSLIMFDIDHFKKINDTHGHTAGDLVLRELAAQIYAVKRQEDLFARFGGEEFVLLLRDTPKENAIQTADKLRSRIEETQFTFEDQKIPITISIGVATFFSNNYKNYETFFRAADNYLYRAKKEGRNCVQFAKDGISVKTEIRTSH
ncbi:MAG TPA: GGDEF domain-containing protein [Bdellovibrionota bacterium]|nr:GGDEF domain-containing protein [Bdellovibrionota bacterium]